MIGHLLDHVARVWTLAESLDEFRATQREYAVLSMNTEIPFTMNRKRTVVGRVNPGVSPVGERTGYCDLGPVVQERDVVEVIEGPDAPARLEVMSVTTPRGHHIEMRLSEFKGKLPGDDES